MNHLSRRLAAFITTSVADPAARDAATAALIATAQQSAVGSRDPEVVRTLAALDPPDGGLSTPLGRDEPRSMPHAALVTAVSAALAGDPEDGASRMAAAVCAAATAAAQVTGASGTELLDAIAVGLEVATRIEAGLATSDHEGSGWDVVGATGSMGAAAAVARLLGSDDDTVAQALGVAATQAAGLRVARGTTTWLFHVGKAAANGTEAAVLCHAGFSGPPAGIEGRRGLFAVAAPGSQEAPVLDGLGERWITAAGPSPTVADDPIHRVVEALARSEAAVDELLAACRTGPRSA